MRYPDFLEEDFFQLDFLGDFDDALSGSTAKLAGTQRAIPPTALSIEYSKIPYFCLAFIFCNVLQHLPSTNVSVRVKSYFTSQFLSRTLPISKF